MQRDYGKSEAQPGSTTSAVTIGGVCLPGSIWRTDHLEAAGYVEGGMERGAGGASPAVQAGGGVCAGRTGG